jgi:hypothetical protein
MEEERGVYELRRSKSRPDENMIREGIFAYLNRQIAASESREAALRKWINIDKISDTRLNAKHFSH